MAKARLRDIIVVLPGITGSVLQKDGVDVWAASGSVVFRTLRKGGAALDVLRIEQDSLDQVDLGDGIVADRLIDDVHIVPGVHKIDGYTGLRRMIERTFDVIPGIRGSDKPANYFEFPYDWRRPNQISATLLDTLLKEALPRWREYSGAKDARVILLAHSMGGLVSRYYLEILGGWKDCKALISFGTPYRGSLDSLGFLANGYKKLFLDLSAMIRSFTSVYQLLPIYPCVGVDGKDYRVTALPDIQGPGAVQVAKALEHVDFTRAKEALAFHRSIESCVNEHNEIDAYRGEGYKIIPVVGIRQDTLQSATIEESTLTCHYTPPQILPPELADGDGTVPRVSAIPIELSTEYRDTFAPAKHAAIQNHEEVLDYLAQILRSMQAPDISNIRGGFPEQGLEEQPALALTLDDMYMKEEPVHIQASTKNTTLDACDGLQLRLEPVGASGTSKTVPLTTVDDMNAEIFLNEDPGQYRVHVSSVRGGPGMPLSVSDIFEVVD